MFKWLYLDTVLSQFPSTSKKHLVVIIVDVPKEVHQTSHTSTPSINNQIVELTSELGRVKEEYETYRKKSRMATVKLQQEVEVLKKKEDNHGNEEEV